MRSLPERLAPLSRFPSPQVAALAAQRSIRASRIAPRAVAPTPIRTARLPHPRLRSAIASRAVRYSPLMALAMRERGARMLLRVLVPGPPGGVPVSFGQRQIDQVLVGNSQWFRSPPGTARSGGCAPPAGANRRLA